MCRHNPTKILALLLLLVGSSFAQSTGTSLAGRWEAPSAGRGGATTFVFDFEVHGNTFRGAGGTVGDPTVIENPTVFRFVDGKINGNEISFTWLIGNRRMFVVTGKLYGDQLNLLLEDAPEKPDAKVGRKYPLTAFRNRSKRPFDWTVSGNH